MKHTFEAQGLTFTKSSKSDTDWTKQCVGVHAVPSRGTALLADSVTEGVLRLNTTELMNLLRTVR